MIIEVMSKNDAELYSTCMHKDKSIIISITSVKSLDAYIIPTSVNGITDMIRVKYTDTDYNTVGISIKDIKRIADFVKRYKYNKYIDKLIIHCEAGQSRSAGVAAAIMKYLNNDDTPIISNSKYIPNMVCYRYTLEALMEE